ncbi:MAG: HXXEE domain-containing protein [Pseudolabrys sp.]
MLSRLMTNWVYGGFLASFVVLALVALFRAGLSAPLLLVVLQLPIYMIHQLEEHDADRFRRFVNSHIGGGHEVLSTPAVFVINVGGVWGVNLISIWLAATIDIGFGLIGIYATLVNAFVHIVAAVVQRQYNPGLVTAIVLFLPAAVVGLWLVAATGQAGWPYQLTGLAVAIGIHAAIVAHVLRRRRAYA